MTNLMELRHHTTQHSGDEPLQEDVFCFLLLCSNKAIQVRAKVRAKWTYMCHLEHFRCPSSGSKALKQWIGWWHPCQEMASSVCQITLTVPAHFESMFVYVPEARSPTCWDKGQCVWRGQCPKRRQCSSITTTSWPHPPLVQITAGTHHITHTRAHTHYGSVNC